VVSSAQPRPGAEDRWTGRASDPDATVLVGDRSGDASAPFTMPARLGRYIVVEQVGAGGMGRVLRVYDPKLRREIALKVLTANATDAASSARIVREAQAMARLSHPNLVPVYDVEQDDDAVFLAMELVEGDTLRRWLAETKRSWQEIVAAFVEAGRGLAAAHAAGVVHRDFKPNNVMVGTDGRVRVMDFGLARGISANRNDGDDESVDDHALAALSSELTQAGTVIGTPPYMAPEQHLGAPVVPSSDQYAFCVALYEALFGQRPFTGTDLRELVRAKQRGVPELPDDARRVPGWLRTTVVRGLAVDPGDRWSSMDALLAALARGRTRARRRRVMLGVAVVGFAGAAASFVHQVDVRMRTNACEQAGASIEEMWNDESRARVRAAMLATGASYAATTADRVIPRLDAQAEAWQRARTEACLDGEVRGAWQPDTVERSSWCLDDRRFELEALVEELSRADATAVQRAVSAAASLASVDLCRDESALQRLPSPPTEQREEIRAVLLQISRAGALEHVGEFDEGLAVAQAAVAGAQALAWPPLSAAAHDQEAKLLERHGDYDGAVRSAELAYFEAARVGAWDIAVGAAARLVFVVGLHQARHEAALAWGRHAELAILHAGDPAGLRESSRLSSVAAVHSSMGDHATARWYHERALALREQALGSEHPELAASITNLAGVHYDAGDYEQARVLQERAVAIRETAFGPDHPDSASSIIKLGILHHMAGELEQAREAYERGLAIQQRAFGPDHPDVLQTLSNLAGVDLASGEHARALAVLQRVLESREAMFGAEHPIIADSLNNLAGAYTAMDKRADALPLLERALAIREKAFGSENAQSANALDNLAAVYVDNGEYERARPLQRRALAILEKTLGPKHPSVAVALYNLAIVESATNNEAEALRLAERSLAIFETHAGVQNGEIGVHFTIARAMVATGGDRDRAIAHAEQARDGWRAAGPAGAEDLAEVESWLAAHGSR